MASRRGAGIGDYLKEAFTYRWNLLLLGGASAVAIMSGMADVALPLVCAAELAYLATLTSIPHFQKYVDAKLHAASKGRRQGNTQAAQPSNQLTNMIAGLDRAGRSRFQTLRTRCLEMRRIAKGVRGQHGAGHTDNDDIRTPSLDRLLWVFLRLLFSQQALQRFLDTTDEQQIERQLSDARDRFERAQDGGDERILRSLQDSIATSELRLDNYRKTERNADFVQIELDRIEGKIQALTEMAISHQDPDYISSQVDSVAESMTHTEDAIRELNQITGLTDDLEGPPAILESGLVEVANGPSH